MTNDGITDTSIHENKRIAAFIARSKIFRIIFDIIAFLCRILLWLYYNQSSIFLVKNAYHILHSVVIIHYNYDADRYHTLHNFLGFPAISGEMEGWSKF